MKFIHVKMTFIYGHIHPCRWIKIILTLSYKLKAPSLGFTFMRKSFSIWHDLASQRFHCDWHWGMTCACTMAGVEESFIEINSRGA